MPRSQSQWRCLDQRELLTTHYLTIEEWSMRHAADAAAMRHAFTILRQRDYVQVAALTPAGQAVLILQDRVAEGPSLEVVAGHIEIGQTPEQAATQELADESGWHASELHYLGIHAPQTDRVVSATPGNDGAKRCHMFLARNVFKVSRAPEPGEKITPVLVPWHEAVSAAITGTTVAHVGLPIVDSGSRLILIVADAWRRSSALDSGP